MAEILNKACIFAFSPQIQSTGADSLWDKVANPEAASYIELPYNKDKSIPEYGTGMSETNSVTGGGLKKESTRIYTDDSGLCSLPFEMDATVETLALHIGSAMQAVVRSGYYTGTKPKSVITDLFHSSNINLSNKVANYSGTDATTYGSVVYGWLQSILFGHPDRIHLEVLKNAVIDNLKFSVDFNKQGFERCAKLSGVWKGTAIDSTSYDYDDLTALTSRTKTYINRENKLNIVIVNITKNVTYTNPCIRNYELNINRNVTSDCKASTNVAGNLKMNPADTIALKLPYTTSGLNDSLIADFRAGDTFAITLSGNAVDATSDNWIAIKHHARMSKQPIAYEGEYLALDLQFDVIKYDATSSTDCAIQVNDNIAVVGNEFEPA